MKSILKGIIPKKILIMREKEFDKETHINRALSGLKNSTYVEIGVKSGDCFRKIKASKKIGIDPQPLPDNYELAAGETFFKETSDNFFILHADDFFGDQRIDVAFIDGLHEFTQVIRDIYNLERFLSPKGVIFIHDLNPTKRWYTGEDCGGYWTGDVWKAGYYLRHFRQDLRFFTLNCDWGLGVLTGFRSSFKPGFPTPDILTECEQLDYSYLEQNRKHILHLRPYWYSFVFFNLVYVRGDK